MGQNRNKFSFKQLLRQVWGRVEQQDWRVWAIAPSATLLVAAAHATGILQIAEWAVLDQFFQRRPLQPIDERIVVITIDDVDISRVGSWPIPDQSLADVLLKIRAQQPRVIGLDLYRDLPVAPGQKQLTEVFESTPNLIGIEKRFGAQAVPPSPVLKALDRVAMADLVEDSDGTVRRGLMTARDDASGQVYLGLATRIALEYLGQDGIQLEPVGGSSDRYRLGKAQFAPFSGNDGAYVGADDNGYQILLNWQNPHERFRVVSLRDVLHGDIPPDFLRDRIVLIGSAAESTHDFFWTPYTGGRQIERTPGVFIHANLISQILRAALNGQSSIHVLPDILETVWLLLWSIAGAQVSWQMLQRQGWSKQHFYGKIALLITLTGAACVGVSYLVFLSSLWVPVVAPLAGLGLSAIISIGLHNQKLRHLAFVDGLTQVGNRRYFDQVLAQRSSNFGSLSLILCDVDCFKAYNDTYGHQAGDQCLQQVAGAIRRAIRRSDLVCRYGGEEFVIVLPATLDIAAQVAENVVLQVRELQLAHSRSTTGDYVTLSCGVTSVVINQETLNQPNWSPASLIAEADAALYVAKKAGRNQYVLAPSREM